jgi:hypothetical protein
MSALTREEVMQIAQQTAHQAAQQVAEQVLQGVLQSGLSTRTATQSSGTTAQERITPEPNFGREREYEIGRDEAWSKAMFRTSNEYQQESLESIKRNRSYVDKLLADHLGYDLTARNIATQALQNAVETANMVGKQAVRHSDLSIDRQWNMDETNFASADVLKSMGSDTSVKQALMDLLVKAVADAISEKEKKA